MCSDRVMVIVCCRRLQKHMRLERDLNAKQKRRMLQKVTRNRDKLEKKLGRPLQLIKK